jgi:FMN reductase
MQRHDLAVSSVLTDKEKASIAKEVVLVVGLGGSLASPSRSLLALQTALNGAAAAGADIELLDLRRLDLPMYRPDLEPSASVLAMARSLYRAQGLIWSSPMYNGTISGSFKNALDWLHLLGDWDPPYLTDSIVGLISTAGGTQGLQAVNTMEFVVRALRAMAIPLVVPVARAQQALEASTVTDPMVERQLLTLGGEVARVSSLFAHGERLEEECARAKQAVSRSASVDG